MQPPKIEPVKRIAAVVGTAALGSQAGHLLAYELRYGAAAQQMQSAGAHAYWPTLVKTFLGAGALVAIAAILVIGFARLATGRRLDPRSSPSFVRLLAVLYTMQLAFFVAQETVEGSVVGRLFLWGMLGQLPVALAAALALRWLATRLGPALDGLRVRCAAALQLLTVTTVRRPAPVPALVAVHRLAGPITRRGPPSF